MAKSYVTVPQEIINEVQSIRKAWAPLPPRFPMPLKKKVIDFIEKTKSTRGRVAKIIGVQHSTIIKWKNTLDKLDPKSSVLSDFIPIKRSEPLNVITVRINQSLSLQFSTDISPAWIVSIIKELQDDDVKN
jgi:hypothetical protein